MRSVINSDIKVYIKEGYFTGNSENVRKLRCRIVGVTTYVNERITFDVLVSESFLYHNITIEHLSHIVGETPEPSIFSKYVSNGNNENHVQVFPFLEQNVYVTDIRGEVHRGNYCFSIDLVNDNNIFHFVKLDNGNCALVPSHKISFTETPLPRNWIKNRHYNSV